MNKPIWPEALQLAGLALAGLLAWWVLRPTATTDSPQAIENALRQLRPADVESVTVYPFGPGTTRPFQLRTAAGVGPLLPALRQLAAAPAGPDTLAAEPLATFSVRLQPAAVARWHLRGRQLIFRLAGTGPAATAHRAGSPVGYRAAALNQLVRHLRDSLAGR